MKTYEISLDGKSVKVEAETASKARYKCWLEYEIRSIGYSFGEFCKRCKVRSVAF